MTSRKRDPAKVKIRRTSSFVVIGADLTRADIGRLLACVRDISRDRVKDGKPKLMHRYQ